MFSWVSCFNTLGKCQFPAPTSPPHNKKWISSTIRLTGCLWGYWLTMVHNAAQGAQCSSVQVCEATLQKKTSYFNTVAGSFRLANVHVFSFFPGLTNGPLSRKAVKRGKSRQKEGDILRCQKIFALSVHNQIPSFVRTRELRTCVNRLSSGTWMEGNQIATSHLLFARWGVATFTSHTQRNPGPPGAIILKSVFGGGYINIDKQYHGTVTVMIVSDRSEMCTIYEHIFKCPVEWLYWYWISLGYTAGMLRSIMDGLEIQCLQYGQVCNHLSPKDPWSVSWFQWKSVRDWIAQDGTWIWFGRWEWWRGCL